MSFIDAYESLVDFTTKNERKKKVEKKIVTKKETMKKEEKKKRSRSKSPQRKVEPVVESFDPDIPSRQFGDLYCKVCDSHMNSEQMWESHIIGKRHLKSTRKGEAAEQKYEYLDEKPTIQKELDKETRPIAGLDHICEILRNSQPPIYQCFLCSASLQTSKSLFDHIMGLKHQVAFLKENVKDKMSLVEDVNLPKSSLEPIVHDLIADYEKNHGRGKMSVKKEKPGSLSFKKSLDDGDRHYTSKSKNTSLPKSSKPPPKSARYSPRSPTYSPPPKSSRYSPSPKSSRYSPPPKSYRDSPSPKSYRDSPPPKSYRDSPPPKAYRDSPPPKSYRDSPPKSFRKRERSLESQWEKVSPNRETSRERMYSDRSYSEEEKWKKVKSDPAYYRRIPVDQDTDARLEQASKYRRALPVCDIGSDLRVVLEQKKNYGLIPAATRASMDMPTSNPNSFEFNCVSDGLLKLVSDMSPEVLLKLTLHKLNNMTVREEIELECLDQVAKKASALVLAVKKSISALDLESRYRETLARNGISNEVNNMMSASPRNSSQFSQNLDDLIGHYKARKTTGYEDDRSKDSYYNLLTAPEQYHDSQSSSRHQLYASSQYRNTPERASTFDSGWTQRSSTTSLPFQSFSSTPTSIPGLTLTEESSAQPSASAVMNQLAQTAKSIFGNINVPSTTPTNTYPSEDYNRLTYRY